MFAILPAAGSGVRLGTLGNKTSKVLLPLQGGDSLLAHSIRALVTSGICSGVAVAYRDGDRKKVEQILKDEAGSLSQLIVEGGQTRQESVFNCLRKIPEHCEYVLVHDAARPLVDPVDIKNVVALAKKCGAAILAEPVHSTVKRVDTQGKILATVPRDQLYLAQTPQVFSRSLLLKAFSEAEKANYLGTDEAELVERLGVAVQIVEGLPTNIKITTSADLDYARSISKSNFIPS